MNYQLLDSGDFEKLEQFGDVRIVRPAAQAVWTKSLPAAEWQNWHARFERFADGKGEWKHEDTLPKHWNVKIDDLIFQVRFTSFGHVGLFAEQKDNWKQLKTIATQLKAKLERPPLVLNLFGYTGASSLACALGGADIVHVDASKGTVDWCKKNFVINQMATCNIRYIVDDVAEFVAREIRRDKRYDAIILDPPTYGRGPNKQLWQIDKHLVPLLHSLKKLLDESHGFVLLTCHSPGYSPVSLHNLLSQVYPQKNAQLDCREMKIDSGLPLPSGVSGWMKYGFNF